MKRVGEFIGMKSDKYELMKRTIDLFKKAERNKFIDLPFVKVEVSVWRTPPMKRDVLEKRRKKK